MLEFDLDKVLRLRLLPSYRVEEIEEVGNKKVILITYFPPSITDASGLEEADSEPKYFEIRGEVDEVTRKVKIVRAEIIEENKRRELDESELQLWAEYLIGGD